MALARLAGVAGLVPSVDWLLYSAIRKEALLTSQIEGTQATLVDLFNNEAGQTLANPDDVEEVTNYLRAFHHVQSQLRRPDGLPLSVRLLCQAHRLLMDGVRGAGRQPGELRQSQNWIGGTTLQNASFVPPPVHEMNNALSDFEKFIHNTTLMPVLQAGILH
ncbi:MAG: Fic family protein, partial [Burkholderiaceae bacterium]